MNGTKQPAMTRITSPALPLLGRVMLAAIFILSGFGKLTAPEGTIAYIVSHGVPAPQAAYVVALIVELGGGLAVAFGLFTPLVALGMAAFTVVTAFAFHMPMSDMGQFINFWKNISMTGGFLMLAAHGPGAWSLDALLARRRGVPLPGRS